MLYSVHFLRFGASFAVLFAHSTGYYTGMFVLGGAGVDLFFVISGVVIGLSVRDNAGTRDFLLRRVIRVLPTYWIATLGYCALQYWAWKTVPNAEMVIRSALLLPKFGTSWSPIYYPAWTLCYELYFYSMMVSVMFFFRSKPVQICALVLAVVAVSQVPVPWTEGKYFQSELGLEFVAGLLISECVRAGLRTDRRIGTACVILSICVFLANSGVHAVPSRTLAWGVPSALAIIGGLAFENSRFLRSKIVRIGGDISYSLYLFHLSVLVLIREASARQGIDVAKHPIVFVVIPILVSLTAAFVINRWIETPLLDALRRRLLSKQQVKSGKPVYQDAEGVHSCVA